MGLLVVGTVALDSVETPTEVRDNILGGSAVFFSTAASHFINSVNLVGVVGDDWPAEHTALLHSRNVDTSGLQVISGGKTFRWRGKYQPNMNDRDTLEVHLNVLEQFNPVLPPKFTQSQYVFLANDSPKNQMKVLEQATSRKLAVADTMDLWINIQNDELRALMKQLDGLVLNDSEAKLLTDDENLVRADTRCSIMVLALSLSKKANMARCSLAAKKPTSCPLILRKKLSIPRVLVIASPVG